MNIIVLTSGLVMLFGGFAASLFLVNRKPTPHIRSLHKGPKK